METGKADGVTRCAGDGRCVRRRAVFLELLQCVCGKVVRDISIDGCVHLQGPVAAHLGRQTSGKLAVVTHAHEDGVEPALEGVEHRAVDALRVGDDGELLPLVVFEEGRAVFPDESAAFVYMMSLAKRDLQYRGMLDDRVASFEYKQDANFLLYRRVLASTSEHEFELYRQSWDLVNRPSYA